MAAAASIIGKISSLAAKTGTWEKGGSGAKGSLTKGGQVAGGFLAHQGISSLKSERKRKDSQR